MFLSDVRELQQWQQHMEGGIEVHRRHEKDMYKGEAGSTVWPAVASLDLASQQAGLYPAPQPAGLQDHR